MHVLMSAYNDFLDQVVALRGKSRRMFLSGQVTLSEARQISECTRSHLRPLMDRFRLIDRKRHSQVEGSVPPVNNIYELAFQLDLLPSHIARVFAQGQITLMQACHAHRLNFGAKELASLVRGNEPTRPWRERKPKLGTVLSPIPIRVRPRVRMSR